MKVIGLKIDSVSDILDLQVEDLLKRRLSTVVVSNGLANTPQQARQMVTHKRIIVGNNVINIPSYIVPIELESKIKVKHKLKKEVKINENIVQGVGL